TSGPNVCATASTSGSSGICSGRDLSVTESQLQPQQPIVILTDAQLAPGRISTETRARPTRLVGGRGTRLQSQRMLFRLRLACVAERPVDRLAIQPVGKLIPVMLASRLPRFPGRNQDDRFIPIRG